MAGSQSRLARAHTTCGAWSLAPMQASACVSGGPCDSNCACPDGEQCVGTAGSKTCKVSPLPECIHTLLYVPWGPSVLSLSLLRVLRVGRDLCTRVAAPSPSGPPQSGTENAIQRPRLQIVQTDAELLLAFQTAIGFTLSGWNPAPSAPCGAFRTGSSLTWFEVQCVYGRVTDL
jgi:hypothetical protein